MVKLSGLPYDASAEEIIGFFEGYELRPESLKMDPPRSAGTGSSSARIKFTSAKEASRAVRELDRKNLRNRWIGLQQL